MPRRSKRRKTGSETAAAAADETPSSTVQGSSGPGGKRDGESKMEAEAEKPTVQTQEQPLVPAPTGNAEAHIDTVSNASEAPTFDDIDPAVFDEEEVPDFDVDQGAMGAQSQGPVSGGRPAGFNALKSFRGQMYTGMAIGGSHKWNYDQGVWKETKTEPDLWKIDFETTKRRARNAPRGSGAPVGTEYHWLIVAHQDKGTANIDMVMLVRRGKQHVKKIDANTYTTHLVGSKYKLAHKNVNSASWSVPTVKAQRAREVELLEDAKRRVQGLPPVLAGEKAKVDKGAEKGQQKLDALFSRAGGGAGGHGGVKGKGNGNSDGEGGKRKRGEDET